MIMSIHPEMEESTETVDEPKQRSGAWHRLKKRWNRKGVVEVDVDHHRYKLLNLIRNGIRDLITNHPELGPKENLSPDDYTHKLTKSVSFSDKVFKFSSYSSPVFASIRQAVGLSEESYLNAVAPKTLPYLEFVSNSKSGQFFYISNDKSFFLKTEKRYYIKVLQNLLGEYLEHFLRYPHSLMVKILGVYSIKVPGEKKLYFYVMQSIFYPEERIDTRYDVKGCLAGRFQEPPKPGKDVVTVLKDQNFDPTYLELGDQREWFLEQFNIDVAFLQQLGVIDYSLLVGTQELHQDERKQDLGDLVLRVKKSVMPLSGSGTGSAAASPVHKQDENGGEQFELKEINLNEGTNKIHEDTTTTENIGQLRRPSLKAKKLSFMECDGQDDVSNSMNRRLLPSSKNPLHVLDGSKCRYYLGIIDFLTLYECRQRTGRIVKSIRHCCGDHSTLPPEAYATRFRDFIREHVK